MIEETIVEFSVFIACVVQGKIYNDINMVTTEHRLTGNILSLT